MSKLTHLNEAGEANMVDVSDKNVTTREARAQVSVYMNAAAFVSLQAGQNKKGDVIATARIAGIQAAKKTSELIPLCHPLMLKKVQVDFDIDKQMHAVHIKTYCKVADQTGVEMEALTAASVAALTIYDMCKAVDKHMRIEGLQVVAKSGGKAGDWEIDPAQTK
ncbi:cyclic pyranopterin monophosphate synthase MoaC [Gayadomonas joobiniege]|uniref:cyclic pyranopterin monophosphate synthase MoaC n=1 Tax=Gayadomonas joobiniege TaxID=1234606 RepID=UPI000373618B|nr:cyclic pyranopterin monophosphate synthase MoaC [Gayadomonas joobiniege]